MKKHSFEMKQLVERNKLGNHVADHMSYIFPMILKDKFNFSFKKITNFYNGIVAMRTRLQDKNDNEITYESLQIYTHTKKIDVQGWVKSIPFSQRLYMADIQNGRVPLGAEQNINLAFMETMLITVPVLKETYRFSNAKIEEFMYWVKDFVDSYARKQPGIKDHYLCDDDIWQTFIDEEHWDIRKGEKVG